MEKNIKDVPFNATQQTQKYWEDFVSQTLAGNALLAIKAFHNYTLAKGNLVREKKGDGREM